MPLFFSFLWLEAVKRNNSPKGLGFRNQKPKGSRWWERTGSPSSPPSQRPRCAWLGSGGRPKHILPTLFSYSSLEAPQLRYGMFCLLLSHRFQFSDCLGICHFVISYLVTFSCLMGLKGLQIFIFTFTCLFKKLCVWPCHNSSKWDSKA